MPDRELLIASRSLEAHLSEVISQDGAEGEFKPFCISGVARYH
jgi:hypothetical protein